jgi:hypothetical protein
VQMRKLSGKEAKSEESIIQGVPMYSLPGKYNIPRKHTKTGICLIINERFKCMHIIHQFYPLNFLNLNKLSAHLFRRAVI